MEKTPQLPNECEQELARLRAENASLRGQLEDAQETLSAIQEGAVDALVIDTPQGKRVFTLQGADQTYRHLIEQMREGAVTLTPQGVIHYCNRRFAEMLGVPLERVMGSRMEDFVTAADRAVLAAIVTEGAGRREMAFSTAGAKELPVQVSAASLLAEGPAVLCLVVSDLTERNRQEVAIRELNRELEERVLRRTAQLAATNRSLEAEIAERKRTEESLARSEREFRLLAESMPAIVWTAGADGLNTYFNQKWVDYTGLTLEEGYGPGWVKPVHPDDQQRAWDTWQNAVVQNAPYLLQCRLRRADGSYRWWLIHGVPVLDENGGTSKWFGTCTDIDDMKQAEQALRESEQLYRAIGESIDYGVWICDPEGRNIYASDSFLKLVGITQQQCSEFGWGDVLHPDDADRTIAAWKECVRTGGTWDIEHRFRGVDQQWHSVLARGVPVRDEQGRITAWAGINLDISRLKRAEEMLRKSEERHRLLAETMLQGVVHHDAEGTIVAMNPAAVRILGKTPAEFLGSSSTAEEHHTIREDGSPFPGVEHPAMTALRTGQSLSGVVMGVFNPRANAYRWISIDAVPLFQPGEHRPCQVYTVFEDITDKKRAEQAIKEANDLLERRVAERTAELRDSEERLRLAVEGSNGAEWEIGVDEHRPECLSDAIKSSPRLGQFIGFAEGEFSASVSAWFARIHPDDIATIRDSARAHLEGRSPLHHVEYRIRHKDESWRWIASNGRLFRDAAGRPLHWAGVDWDITERKWAEEALRAVTMELRRTLDTAATGLTRCNRDLRYVSANPAYAKLTGRPLEQVIGMPIADVMGKAAFEVIRPWVERVLRGEPVEYEAEVPYAMVRKKFIHVVYTPDQDSNGNIVGWVASVTDITERKRAEEAIAASEREFRLLAEAMPQIVWATRADGWNTYFNQQWVDYTGLTLEESYGHGWNKPFHPDDQQRAWDAWQNAVMGRGTYVLECRLRRADGIYRWWLIRGVPVLGEDGNIAKWFGTCTDIDDMKQAEETLRRERTFVTAVLETIGALVVVLDREGRIVRFNRACEAATGYSSAEVQGRCFWDFLLAPEEMRSVQEVFTHLQAGQFPSEHQNDWVARDGTRRRIHWSNSGLTDEAGEVQYVIGSGLDITERKRAEEALQRLNAELEHRVAEQTTEIRKTYEESLRARNELTRIDRIARMSELAASLAHELNQPLTAILSNAQAARRFFASGAIDPAMFREIVDDIIRDAKRAGGVIHRVRLMLQKKKHEPETFTVNDAIQEAAQLLHSEILGRNVVLRMDLAPHLSAVKAERVEIQQVMINLLLNALDAVKDLPPDRREILIRSTLENNVVAVAIQDRGCGIQSPDINAIFDPFFTTKSAGLGMGLAICLRTIEAHGGRIWAVNNEDAGATVLFSLPCTQARQEPSRD